MSDGDSPRIGEALARIEANQGAMRELVEARLADVLARQAANENQNEQANNFAREGIERIDKRLSAVFGLFDSERSRVEIAITAVRRDLNQRLDNVELQTATRAGIVEDRVSDLEDAEAKRTWAVGLARPVFALIFGGCAAAVGIGVDRLLT